MLRGREIGYTMRGVHAHHKGVDMHILRGVAEKLYLINRKLSVKHVS